jgi:PhzF family phenazine biosynthesis protein
VPVQTRQEDGRPVATLTSVEPSVQQLSSEALASTLQALGWSPEVLDDALPPYVGFAGNYHPVLAVSSREVLAGLDYDYAALADLMHAHDWTTLQLVHRERPDLFHARNPFPPGGVVEDPATGAAAAALGGYLRAMGLVPPSRRVTIRQGEDMGRPSVLLVDIPEDGGIDVTGSATRL